MLKLIKQFFYFDFSSSCPTSSDKICFATLATISVMPDSTALARLATVSIIAGSTAGKIRLLDSLRFPACSKAPDFNTSCKIFAENSLAISLVLLLKFSNLFTF